MNWLALIDKFLLIFHSLFIVFNLTGWIWQYTRKLHLVSILLTFASWFILGIFWGWGYCPLTDWHWEVLNRLGRFGLPNSYVAYLTERITGISLPGKRVDALTLLLALTVLGLSLWFNYVKPKTGTQH